MAPQLLACIWFRPVKEQEMYPTYLWGNRDYSSEIASSLSGQLLFLGVRSAAPKLLRYQLGTKPQEEEGRGKGRAGSWGWVVGCHALKAGCTTGFQFEEPFAILSYETV